MDEVNKGCKNVACETIQKWNVDARCMHIFHWKFFVMVEVMNPNDADGPI
jgi:hypothetical protein